MKNSSAHPTAWLTMVSVVGVLGVLIATMASQYHLSLFSKAALIQPTPTPVSGTVKPDCYPLLYRACESSLYKVGQTGTGNIGGYTCSAGYWTVVTSLGAPACAGNVTTIDVICGSMWNCPGYFPTPTPSPKSATTPTPKAFASPTRTRTPTPRPTATRTRTPTPRTITSPTRTRTPTPKASVSSGPTATHAPVITGGPL